MKSAAFSLSLILHLFHHFWLLDCFDMPLHHWFCSIPLISSFEVSILFPLYTSAELILPVKSLCCWPAIFSPPISSLSSSFPVHYQSDYWSDFPSSHLYYIRLFFGISFFLFWHQPCPSSPCGCLVGWGITDRSPPCLFAQTADEGVVGGGVFCFLAPAGWPQSYSGCCIPPTKQSVRQSVCMYQLHEL